MLRIEGGTLCCVYSDKLLFLSQVPCKYLLHLSMQLCLSLFFGFQPAAAAAAGRIQKKESKHDDLTLSDGIL